MSHIKLYRCDITGEPLTENRISVSFTSPVRPEEISYDIHPTTFTLFSALLNSPLRLLTSKYFLRSINFDTLLNGDTFKWTFNIVIYTNDAIENAVDMTDSVKEDLEKYGFTKAYGFPVIFDNDFNVMDNTFRNIEQKDSE